MCNCISEMEKKLKDEAATMNEKFKDLQIDKVSCDVLGWGVSKNTVFQTVIIPFIANHQLYKRKTKTRLILAATYCPFCGEKLFKEE